VWSALYQQRPTAQEGGTIKRVWLNQFYKALPDKMDEYIQSWDLTFKETKGTDFVVGQVWGRKGASFYLVDQVRDRMDFPTTCTAIQSMTSKHPRAYSKLVEDKANGPAVISSMKQKVTGLIPIEPNGSKEARASAVSPLFEAGNIWLPDPSIKPWVHDYIEELCTFPNGMHDDQVDATTQALNRLQSGASTMLERLVKF
jgi:predicted phage terminase large subunit-like protein